MGVKRSNLACPHGGTPSAEIKDSPRFRVRGHPDRNHPLWMTHVCPGAPQKHGDSERVAPVCKGELRYEIPQGLQVAWTDSPLDVPVLILTRAFGLRSPSASAARYKRRKRRFMSSGRAKPPSPKDSRFPCHPGDRHSAVSRPRPVCEAPGILASREPPGSVFPRSSGWSTPNDGSSPHTGSTRPDKLARLAL